MSEITTGLAGSDVLVGAALAVTVPLCALALSPLPRKRTRPGLSFACYWVLLLLSTVLVTSAVVNLTMIASSGLWVAAGGAGVIGILVTFSRARGPWPEQRDASERSILVRDQ